jgi:hypothetical protein
MTEWLSPSVLARSAVEVVVSKLFADYADKREFEGGLSDERFKPPPGSGTFWLDYASDVGDGFDSTYTIAHFLAAPTLDLRDDSGELHETERGRMLVLGGDEVYPSASWKRYEEHFIAPYSAALPHIDEPGARPRMFAVPGNHDWYDGLTSFMRLFCQDKSIGGWQTQQKRSYFALELPHRWWLWGIDIQFDSYIDGPQIEYFTQAAEQTSEGDRIILATAKPSWVAVRDAGEPPQSWMSLAYFQERVLCRKGAELALTLTGDLHHYARYEPTGAGDPKLTAGGGGAYLSATHWLPSSLDLPSVGKAGAVGKQPTAAYTLETSWPSADASRGIRKGILWHLLPWKTHRLNRLTTAIYAVIALLLAVGIKDQDASLAPSLGAHSGLALVGDAITFWGVLLALGLIAGLGLWARGGEAPMLLGWVHAALQLAAATALTLLLLEADLFGLADDGFWLGYVTAVAVGLLSWLAARWILVAYLFLMPHLNDRWHVNEAFAGQALTSFKHFLRLKIEADRLTVYAIGVEAVPSDWTGDEEPAPTAGWPEPVVFDRREIPYEERKRSTSATSSS